MSLLRRMAKIQQGEGAPAAPDAPAPAAPDAAPPATPAPATASAPAATPAAPAAPTAAPPATPAPAVAPTAAPVTRLAAGTPRRATAREELLRDVRRHLRDEVTGTSASLIKSAGAADLRHRVEEIVDRVTGPSGFAVTRDERLRLIEGLVSEIEGFGPLEPLLNDDTITEVMVNGPNQVYIERRGKLELTNVVFLNDDHVLQIIDRIIAPLGRRIDQTSPRVDARLPDGSRVNAIIPPLSLVGPTITVRKFSAKPYTVDDLVSFGTATAEMFDFLRACVEVRLNIFVSGGTGSGKTTTLNVLSSFIPEEERIITIEDAAELQLNQEHVVTLESRPPNLEGEGEITIRDLLRNALHMRPDRIIVGECRAGEALDMIQAMTVGQEGSLSTGHANTPQDMLRRIETMVLMAGVELPLRSIREQISSAVDLIVHTARLKDGTRKIVNITEVFGIEDEDILTQDIFAFEQTGMKDGKVQGRLKPTGIRPTFMGKFAASGIALPADQFGIPAVGPARRGPAGTGKGRWVVEERPEGPDEGGAGLGRGRAVTAGGMVYVSSVGPVDLDTGRVVVGTVTEQTRRCLQNLKARLEAEGSSLDKVVWANWSLRDTSDFDAFEAEWVRWFPGDTPMGQGTLMPPLQRRAGFRISIGVIAEAQAPAGSAPRTKAPPAGRKRAGG